MEKHYGNPKGYTAVVFIAIDEYKRLLECKTRLRELLNEKGSQHSDIVNQEGKGASSPSNDLLSPKSKAIDLAQNTLPAIPIPVEKVVEDNSQLIEEVDFVAKKMEQREKDQMKEKDRRKKKDEDLMQNGAGYRLDESENKPSEASNVTVPWYYMGPISP